MIETKLILLEGLPCSGKSTLSRHLEKEFLKNGYAAKSHKEIYEDHPVIINYRVPYSVDEGERYLEQWAEFAERKHELDRIDLIDNRFWIGPGVFLIYSGFAVDDLLKLNLRAIEILKPLDPVLIHFRHTSADEGIRRICQVRGEKWMNRLLKRDLVFPWYQNRGIKDFEGYLEFWRYWGNVTDKLWNRCPFRKLALTDAYDDWEGNYERVYEFFDL